MTSPAAADGAAAFPGVLTALILATFASAWSMTAVWVAVPAIGTAFSVGPGRVHGVSTAFLGSMLPAMLVMPAMLRRLGARRTGLLALGLLCSAAAAGTCAASLPALVVARALEGWAAGMLQPLPVLVIAQRCPAETRGRAMGQFTLGLTLAPALAPMVAGGLVDGFGWRAVLASTVPLAGLALGALARFLPVDQPIGSAPPACPPRLRHERHFLRASAVAFVYGLASFAGGYLVPVFAQEALGHSARVVGAALLPGGLALAAASPLGGRVADRWPRHRVIALGMALFGAAHLPLLGFEAATSLAALSTCLVLSRCGMALALPSLAIDALRDLPSPAWPVAASYVSLARQAGAAVGIGVASAHVAWRLHGGAESLVAYREALALVIAASLTGALLAGSNQTRQGR